MKIEQERIVEARKRVVNSGLLYIEDHRDAKFKAPSDVIQCLYQKGAYKTYLAKNDRQQVTGSARSIFDMCRIILYYFPDMSIEDCVKGIFSAKVKFSHTSSLLKIGLAGYCYVVKRMVHYPITGSAFGSIIRNTTWKHGSSLHKIGYIELMIHCGIIDYDSFK